MVIFYLWNIEWYKKNEIEDLDSSKMVWVAIVWVSSCWTVADEVVDSLKTCEGGRDIEEEESEGEYLRLRKEMLKRRKHKLRCLLNLEKYCSKS